MKSERIEWDTHILFLVCSPLCVNILNTMPNDCANERSYEIYSCELSILPKSAASFYWNIYCQEMHSLCVDIIRALKGQPQPQFSMSYSHNISICFK